MVEERLMKNTHFAIVIKAMLIVLCLSAVLSSASCTPSDIDITNAAELSEKFMDCLMENNYHSAFSMVKRSIAPKDFSKYWVTIKPLVEGAKSYELEQLDWKVEYKNGVLTNVIAYQVSLDNGKTLLLRVSTKDDVEGIAGVYLADMTDYMNHTVPMTSTLGIVFTAFSVLSWAYVIWMIVDCLRRKPKYKIAWIILILIGFSIRLSIGDQPGIFFMYGLMLQMSSIKADISIMTVITKLVVPTGAILYGCLRKKIKSMPTKTKNTEENNI
jgi:hypothetical protein